MLKFKIIIISYGYICLGIWLYAILTNIVRFCDKKGFTSRSIQSI
jgi:hypothetical protein